MAERTGIMVLIRRHWKSILAAGIAAVTVTALTVTTVTIAPGGSIHIDGDGDLDITADSMIKAAGAADFLIQSENDLDITAIGNGNGTGVITLTGEAAEGSVNLVNGFASIRAQNDTASMRYFGADEGGYLTVGAGGVSIQAMTTGDDISLGANDGLTLSARSGAGGDNYMTFNSLGITLWTEAGTADYIYLSSGGGDITLSSFDDITLTSADLATMATTGGGSVQTRTSGLSLLATNAGDDIAMTAADSIALSVTAGDFGLVSSSVASMTSTAANIALTSSVADIVGTAGDDITLTGADDVTITATAGPLVLVGATGQLQIDATGGIFNGPLSVALVAGGLASRVPPVLDFDYPNAAPASTAKTLMASQAIPAGAMDAVGKGVGFVATGTHLGNANVKRVSVEMGIAADTSGTGPTPQCNFNDATGTGWVVRGYFYRSGDDTQRAFIECMNNGIIQTVVTNATGALDDALPLFVNFTVENPTTAGDFTVHSVRWFWL